MKRGLLCILFVVLLTVNVSAIVVSESTPVVLINEDFSKFVEGAETAPTEQDLADESTGAIDAQYTQQAGWSGMGIFQAGGICAIAPVYNYYFYVNTSNTATTRNNVRRSSSKWPQNDISFSSIVQVRFHQSISRLGTARTSSALPSAWRNG